MNELTIEEFDALSTDTYVLYDIRSTDAVSYTHLDVYKRQPERWA